MHDEDRQPEHQRNPELESLLSQLANDLAPLGSEVSKHNTAPKMPAVFVVGCPRSGTTLTYQWLASLGTFSYPSNFVARFPNAPWLAARIQRLLTDPACDSLGELTLDQAQNPHPFQSRLGKTKGLSAPSEFWYWWRRFLPESESHALSEEQLGAVDLTQMRAELAAWEAVMNKPLLMKGLILNWNLAWLADAVPGSIFVHIKRDPLFNMQSLVAAREDFFGERDSWYSFRPPEYRELKTESFARQIAGQVCYTEAGIERGLALISPQRQLCVSYEELCQDPAAVYQSLHQTMSAANYDLPAAYDGPASFPLSNTVRLPEGDLEAMRAAWHDFSENRSPAYLAD